MQKKIPIVVGITILFLGVGIQPAIATVKSKTQVDDDCEICPSIKKIRILTEINENNKLSNLINEHLESYRNLKQDLTVGDFRPICGILFIIFLQCTIRIMFWINLGIHEPWIYARFWYIFPLLDYANKINCNWL